MSQRNWTPERLLQLVATHISANTTLYGRGTNYAITAAAMGVTERVVKKQLSALIRHYARAISGTPSTPTTTNSSSFSSSSSNFRQNPHDYYDDPDTDDEDPPFIKKEEPMTPQRTFPKTEGVMSSRPVIPKKEDPVAPLPADPFSTPSPNRSMVLRSMDPFPTPSYSREMVLFGYNFDDDEWRNGGGGGGGEWRMGLKRKREETPTPSDGKLYNSNMLDSRKLVRYGQDMMRNEVPIILSDEE